jgi:hypothetical protein
MADAIANACSGRSSVVGDMMVGTAGLGFAMEDCLVLIVGAFEREVGIRLVAILGVVDSGEVTLILALVCCPGQLGAKRDLKPTRLGHVNWYPWESYRSTNSIPVQNEAGLILALVHPWENERNPLENRLQHPQQGKGIHWVCQVISIRLP